MRNLVWISILAIFFQCHNDSEDSLNPVDSIKQIDSVYLLSRGQHINNDSITGWLDIQGVDYNIVVYNIIKIQNRWWFTEDLRGYTNNALHPGYWYGGECPEGWRKPNLEEVNNLISFFKYEGNAFKEGGISGLNVKMGGILYHDAFSDRSYIIDFGKYGCFQYLPVVGKNQSARGYSVFVYNETNLVDIEHRGTVAQTYAAPCRCVRP